MNTITQLKKQPDPESNPGMSSGDRIRSKEIMKTNEAMEIFLPTQWGKEYAAGKRSLNNALDCLGLDYPSGEFSSVISALYGTEANNDPFKTPAPEMLHGTRWQSVWQHWSDEPLEKGWKRLSSEIEDWAGCEAEKVSFDGNKTEVVSVEMRHDRSGTTSAVDKTVRTLEFGNAVKTEKARLLASLGEIWETAQTRAKNLNPVALDSFGNPI